MLAVEVERDMNGGWLAGEEEIGRAREGERIFIEERMVGNITPSVVGACLTPTAAKS